MKVPTKEEISKIQSLILERRLTVVSMETEPATFKELFGDHSDTEFSTALDLTMLNLSSLDGCFAVVNGYMEANQNPALKTLEGCPEYVFYFFQCTDCDSLKSLKGIPKIIQKSSKKLDSILSLQQNPNLSDISALTPDLISNMALISFHQLNDTGKSNKVSIADYIELFREKREILGGFKFQSSQFSNEQLEKAYQLYKKVNFDKEKLNKALELCDI